MKRKILKALLITVLSVIVIVAVAAGYVATFLPNTGAPENITIDKTPDRIERGRYLANNVASCMDCHSQRDWSLYAAPPQPGTMGGGGDRFDQSMGMPGVFYSKNLTPHALASWTDGELFRAITTGVSKDGRAIFPMMPYKNFGKMDKEDICSIIAYLRTLQPLNVDVPASKPDFPVSLLLNTMPGKASLTPKPAESDTVAYGKYLVMSASCGECHNSEKLKLELAGGNEFKLPAGTLRVANITPDKQTGIGLWSRDMFVERFKTYADSLYKPRKVAPDEMNTVMPWTMYAGMKKRDLESIYAYLQTVKPVNNKVVKFDKNL